MQNLSGIQYSGIVTGNTFMWGALVEAEPLLLLRPVASEETRFEPSRHRLQVRSSVVKIQYEHSHNDGNACHRHHNCEIYA